MAYDEAWAKRWLEQKGWKRSVAGEADFIKAVKAVVEYVANPKRGIFIMGQVGVGKTALANVLYGYLKGRKVKIDCADNGMVDLLVQQADSVTNGGIYNSGADEYLGGAVMLDDMGSEEIRILYSNTLDRVGKFIVRYEARGTGRIIVTTNFTMEKLMKRYGDRVVDRILQKCIVLKLEGSSKRNRTIIR